MEVDVTSNAYMQKKLSRHLHCDTFIEVKCMGENVGSRACWERCARSAFYLILSEAVGGNWT